MYQQNSYNFQQPMNDYQDYEITQNQENSDYQDEQQCDYDNQIQAYHVSVGKLIETNEEQEKEVNKFEELLEESQNQKKQSKLHFIKYLKREKYEIITNKLKQYLIKDFLIESGEGILFRAQIQQKNENVIIKFIQQNKEHFKQQLVILNDLQQFKYFIKLLDHQEIYNNIYALVLEECECTVDEKMQKLDINHNYLDFAKIVLSSLQGLIILRIKCILHLDIKTKNILVKENQCIFTDFNCSIKKQNNVAVKARSFTELFSPIELKYQLNNKINYLTDVFSLGQTYKCLFNIVREKNQQPSIFVENLDMISNDMIKTENEERINCFLLFDLFKKQLLIQFDQNEEIKNLILLYEKEMKDQIKKVQDSDDKKQLQNEFSENNNDTTHE